MIILYRNVRNARFWKRKPRISTRTSVNVTLLHFLFIKDTTVSSCIPERTEMFTSWTWISIKTQKKRTRCRISFVFLLKSRYIYGYSLVFNLIIWFSTFTNILTQRTRELSHFTRLMCFCTETFFGWRYVNYFPGHESDSGVIRNAVLCERQTSR